MPIEQHLLIEAAEFKAEYDSEQVPRLISEANAEH